MIITTGTGTHHCGTAQQHGSKVHLLDADGNILLIIHAVKDIRAVEGGQIDIISPPIPTLEDRLNILEHAMADIPSMIKKVIQNFSTVL